jgi:short-subunit dehydrogenase
MDFPDRYGPWALIAGASEGVGASVARLLGERGVKVVLVGRRRETLDEVAAGVASETRSLVCDLNAADAPQRLIEGVADLEIGLVVYNAGASGCLPPTGFLTRPLEHWQGILDRNCLTVMTLAHQLGGRMVRRGHGGIVLVGSTSCWAGTANMAMYGATKAFQLVLAESLWAEFAPEGVDVLAMILGPTNTPAFQRMFAGQAIEGVADCDEVARAMLDSLTAGPTWPPGPSPFGAAPRRDAVARRAQMRSDLFESETEARP